MNNNVKLKLLNTNGTTHTQQQNMMQLSLRTPIDVSLMRPHWYESDEEDAGSEYDEENDDESDEDESPRSITWTSREAEREVQEYLEDKLIDCEELGENQTMALGTWSLLDNKHFMAIKLNVAAYLKCGAIYTKYFGYLHERWNAERPYDILKVYRVLSDGFIEYRAVIKTHWLRLIQRHWINRGPNAGLKGLLAIYNK